MKMRDFTYNDKMIVVLMKETTKEICHWRKGGGGIRERTNA